MGSRHITVNAVTPGPVTTEMLFAGRWEGLIQRLINDIPLGRLGEPDDIARVVSFLAGPDTGWVNSQIIKANGAGTDRHRCLAATSGVQRHPMPSADAHVSGVAGHPVELSSVTIWHRDSP